MTQSLACSDNFSADYGPYWPDNKQKIAKLSPETSSLTITMIIKLTQFVDQTGQLDGVPLVDPDVRRLGDELWDGVDDALVLVEVIVVGRVVVGVVVVRVVIVPDRGVRIGIC